MVSVVNNKRGTTARQKNSNIKSRAILSTDSSSSDEGNITKNVLNTSSPAAIKEGTHTITVTEKPKLLSPNQVQNSLPPRGKTAIGSKLVESSSDDDEEDNGEDDDEVGNYTRRDIVKVKFIIS